MATAVGEGGGGAFLGGTKESLQDMLSRHRQEITNLQNKEMSLKKAVTKGSKAEQKVKKKQVEDDISHQLAQLKAKHAEQLALFGYRNNENTDKGNLDSLVKAIVGVSVSDHSEISKPSKGARRRERRAREEAAKEQTIQGEKNNVISDRVIENERLERKLDPLGLTINEIKPDGHCLYRAIEDQLSLNPKNSSCYNFQELRKMAASYLQSHASDFLPFFLSESKTGLDSDSSLMENFEKYCEDVESTAAWGGQLELGALTQCLRKHIIIYSGSFPDVEMGKEYKSVDGSSLSNQSIMLSYHRHAYGLGEHYNSVVPKRMR